MHSILEEFLHTSRAAENADSLFTEYSKMLDSYGFDQQIFAMVSDHKEFAKDAELGLVSHNMLDDWIEHYRESSYLEVDKTTHLLRANQGIYSWKDIAQRNDLSAVQRRIFHETKDANIHHGHSISMHGPAAKKSVMIISSSQASSKPDQHQLDIINLASYHFQLCFLSLMQAESLTQISPLSGKEQEILKWLSTGMTKQEIADMVKISIHTVDYHSRNILKKMDAKNMNAALVTAIKEGLLFI